MIFIIGDTSTDFADRVKDTYSDAELFLNNQHNPVLYGSLGDSTIEQILPLLMSATEIFFDDQIADQELKEYTYILLHRLITVTNKKVSGFNFKYFYDNLANKKFFFNEDNSLPKNWLSLFDYSEKNFTGLLDYRKSSDNQVWVAGCSTANGTALPDISYAYASIVAKELNMPLSILGKGASTISFSTDQLLRSAVKPGDTVLWGISGVCRLSLFDKNLHEQFVTFNRIERGECSKEETIFALESMNHNNQIATALRCLSQVMTRFDCEGVKLKIIAHPEINLPDQYLPLRSTIETHPGFVNLHGNNYLDAIYSDISDTLKFYKDFGNDNLHPGVQTHKEWAKIILDNCS